VGDPVFYEPTERGAEQGLAARLRAWRARRAAARSEGEG
jgi:hypothetical protein